MITPYENVNAKKILVVGANGRLGSLVTEYLHRTRGEEVKIFGLVRDKKKVGGRERDERGIVFLEGDLFDRDSLNKACQDKFAVISCVVGEEKVFLEGQKNLFDAAKSCGVKRFVASDFTMDYRRLPPGSHPHKDWQREFAEYTDQHKDISTVHIFCGCFMEVFFGFLGVWDKEAKALNFYGSGEEKIDFTSYEDAAAFTVEAVLKEEVVGDVHVCGDRLSLCEVAQLYEAVKGWTVKLNRLGSLQDLEEEIQRLKQDKQAPAWRIIQLQYQLYCVNEKTHLHDLQNDKFPAVKPKSFRDFLTSATDL